MTLRESDDPRHQALGRNFHPATAASSRILHYAVPHHAYYPYYCCLTPAAAIGLEAGCSLRFRRAQAPHAGAVPGRGEGLVISVTLDDPASETAHREVLNAVEGPY